MELPEAHGVVLTLRLDFRHEPASIHVHRGEGRAVGCESRTSNPEPPTAKRDTDEWDQEPMEVHYSESASLDLLLISGT
jgi:hypothetical protein